MRDTYVQVLMQGGIVHDVSDQNWSLLKEEIKSGARFSECEDIYGGECWMVVDRIISSRRITPEAVAAFKEMNEGDSYNEE